MPAAQVWFNWCQKRAKCSRCLQYIEAGEQIVYAKLPTQPYPRVLRRHIHCFIADNVDWLQRNPYYHHAGTGRPKLELSAVDRSMRRKLLVKGANTRLDMRVCSRKLPDTEAQLRIDRLSTKLALLAVELMEVGGVPKKFMGDR